MDITITKTRHYPGLGGLKSEGQLVQDVPENIAAQLIQQGFAVAAAEKTTEAIQASDSGENTVKTAGRRKGAADQPED